MKGQKKSMARSGSSACVLDGLCAAPAGAIGCRAASTPTSWLEDDTGVGVAVNRALSGLWGVSRAGQAAAVRFHAVSFRLAAIRRVRRVERASEPRYRVTSLTPPSQRIEAGLRRAWL